MRAKMNIVEIIKTLRSGELEEQVAALNEISDFTEELADEALKALAVSQSPIVIEEALFRFGVAVRATTKLAGTSLVDAAQTTGALGRKTCPSSLKGSAGEEAAARAATIAGPNQFRIMESRQKRPSSRFEIQH